MLVCISILVITLPVAYIMFQLVVAKSENGSSRDDNALKESKSSVTSAIIVFGVIIPSLVAAPYYLVEKLELQNVILKGFAVVVPLTTIFHVISTFYRYSPRGVEISLTNYLVYNCMMIPPVIVDQKFIPLVGMKEKLTGLKNVVKSYFVVSLVLSFHESLEYGTVASPTPHIEAEDGLYFLLFKIYDTRHLADNFFFAYLFQSLLHFFILSLGFTAQLLVGYKCATGMNNPLLEATSPSDFWGRRWNLVVQGLLKRGVFKPMYYHSSSKVVAVVATFLVSGIMHEWVIDVSILNLAYTPAFGRTTGFFLWNGLFVILEYLIGGWRIFGMIKRVFPKPLITFMLVLCVLPIGHWFCDEYRNIGYFYALSSGFPLITISSN